MTVHRAATRTQTRELEGGMSALLTRCGACGCVEVDVFGILREVTINGDRYLVGNGCEVCS